MPQGRSPSPIELLALQLAPGIRLVLSSAFGGTNKKRGPGQADSDPCPVEPNRPHNLSGGAAAALEYDD
jgi:hypothetical protein